MQILYVKDKSNHYHVYLLLLIKVVFFSKPEMCLLTYRPTCKDQRSKRTNSKVTNRSVPMLSKIKISRIHSETRQCQLRVFSSKVSGIVV